MKQIVFSKKSENELQKLSKYLEIKFSVKVKNDFLDKFEKVIDSIQSNPETFPKSDRNEYHKAVITKQTSIFYRFDEKRIRIVAVFDTRQNPNKIKE